MVKLFQNIPTYIEIGLLYCKNLILVRRVSIHSVNVRDVWAFRGCESVISWSSRGVFAIRINDGPAVPGSYSAVKLLSAEQDVSITFIGPFERVTRRVQVAKLAASFHHRFSPSLSFQELSRVKPFVIKKPKHSFQLFYREEISKISSFKGIRNSLEIELPRFIRDKHQ